MLIQILVQILSPNLTMIQIQIHVQSQSQMLILAGHVSCSSWWGSQIVSLVSLSHSRDYL